MIHESSGSPTAGVVSSREASTTFPKINAIKVWMSF